MQLLKNIVPHNHYFGSQRRHQARTSSYKLQPPPPHIHCRVAITSNRDIQRAFLYNSTIQNDRRLIQPLLRPSSSPPLPIPSPSPHSDSCGFVYIHLQRKQRRINEREKNNKYYNKFMVKNKMDCLCCWSLSKPFYLLLFLFSFPCIIASAAFNLSTISFDEGYSPLFGDGNLVRSPDGRTARLLLDRFTGAGFISSKMYKYGFFSANIKLPGDYTAGLCVAFYTSNGDVFEKTHDELDFEFLGNTEGKPWRFQTNLYGNGSTSRGREERYRLWFDPSKQFHRYSILWTAKNTIFYIDDVPIREVIRSEEMGGEYPSKPMSLYATIWDASNWATSGGKYKVNYKYAPFVSEFKDFVLEGCPSDPIEEFHSVDCYESYSRLESADYATITRRQRSAMRKFRQRYMYYSYCYDSLRYPVPPPECVVIPTEKDRFRDTGRLRFGGSHQGRKRRSRRRGRVQVSSIEYDPDV